MKEFELIEYISKKFGKSNGVTLGIGDDCSIIKPPVGKSQVTTVDSLIEGNHISLKYFSPAEIGRKALRVNLSDIASMGAVGPYYAWIVFTLPQNFSDKVIKGILGGIKSDCKKYGVTVAGGNITSAKNFSIHVTLTGWIKPGKSLTRNGAKVGDTIFVTGTIGASTLAYRQFKSGRKPNDFLLKRWANPEPKIETGKFLSAKGIASACIDISDGIFQDLGHITKLSGVGAHLDWDSLPISPGLRKMNPTPKMIGYGEDYELLFTVPKKRLKWLEPIRKKITAIGHIVKNGFCVSRRDGETVDVNDVGYSHLK